MRVQPVPGLVELLVTNKAQLDGCWRVRLSTAMPHGSHMFRDASKGPGQASSFTWPASRDLVRPKEHDWNRHSGLVRPKEHDWNRHSGTGLEKNVEIQECKLQRMFEKEASGTLRIQHLVHTDCMYSAGQQNDFVTEG